MSKFIYLYLSLASICQTSVQAETIVPYTWHAWLFKFTGTSRASDSAWRSKNWSFWGRSEFKIFHFGTEENPAAMLGCRQCAILTASHISLYITLNCPDCLRSSQPYCYDSFTDSLLDTYFYFNDMTPSRLVLTTCLTWGYLMPTSCLPCSLPFFLSPCVHYDFSSLLPRVLLLYIRL